VESVIAMVAAGNAESERLLDRFGFELDAREGLERRFVLARRA